jgi:hypothetical protein
VERFQKAGIKSASLVISLEIRLASSEVSRMSETAIAPSG